MISAQGASDVVAAVNENRYSRARSLAGSKRRQVGAVSAAPFVGFPGPTCL